jgi:hypothetical protein
MDAMMRSPVFIVGSSRSGTSILVTALRAAGYGGYYEGHVLSLIRVIERDVDRHFDSFYTESSKVLISQVDRADLKARLAGMIGAEAVRHQPDGPWVDKTGGLEMIESIPTLARIFPTARFVFAQRRAIENLVSRMVKFPGHGFDHHCASWAKIMAGWRLLRQSHPDLACIVIDQRDISADPATVAGRLGDFLALETAGRAALLGAFSSKRPQQTEPGSADRVLSLAETGWTYAQTAMFHQHCDTEMQAAGYTMDESYRTVPSHRL